MLAPGTKVKVNKDIRGGRDTPSGLYITREMAAMAGEILTIRQPGLSFIADDRYELKESEFTWSSELFTVYVPTNVVGGHLLIEDSQDKPGKAL